MRRAPLVILLVLAVLSAPANLSGQEGDSADTVPLSPVDQGVADHHPLSTSLRVIEGGIDQPNDFAEVFRIEGDRGTRHVRAQGGLYAVFPHSIYVASSNGEVVTPVPAGTTFHIGPAALTRGVPALRIPSDFALDPRNPSVDLHVRSAIDGLRLDARVDLRALPGGADSGRDVRTASLERRRDWAFKPQANGWQVRTEVRDPDRDRTLGASERTIANDPVYRAHRLRSIVLAAADAYR